MNSSLAISWISQLQGMESSILMDQCNNNFMDPFDEDFGNSEIGLEFHNYLSPTNDSLVSSSSTDHLINIPEIEQSKQQMSNDDYSTFSTIHNMGVLHFGNQHIPCQNLQQVNTVINMNPHIEEIVVPEILKAPTPSTNNSNSEEATPIRVQSTKKRRIRPPSQTYDHIMAERRRREQLSQLFVALSALVPGLKKMDKGSILEDAIKYMKLLQERVKLLEENAEKKSMESLIIVKKSQIIVDDNDEGCFDEQSSSFDEHPLPEIEAKVFEKNILLKVHCEKQKDVLANLICKVESLNMIVVSTSATPFGDVALDITIVAEMEKEFNLTVKEVMTVLRAALQRDV